MRNLLASTCSHRCQNFVSCPFSDINKNCKRDATQSDLSSLHVVIVCADLVVGSLQLLLEGLVLVDLSLSLFCRRHHAAGSSLVATQ